MSAPGKGRASPPAALRWMLACLLPRAERPHLLTEMDDLYARRAARVGHRRAALWYVRHAVGFPVRLGLARARPALAGGLVGAGSVARDLAYGARVLRRCPGYALASVATLGVGIGGVASVYAIANWVLLRPVPGIVDDGRLVTLQLEVRDGGAGFAFPMSDPDLRSLRTRIGSLVGLEASTEFDVHVVSHAGSPPTRIRAEVVTPGYFEALGLTPSLGRRQDGSPGTVVVSHGLWRRIWGGDASVLGSVLRVNDHPYAVVGVAPAGFHGAELPGRAELWLPPSALVHTDPSLPSDILERRRDTVWRDLLGIVEEGVVVGEAARRIGDEAALAIESVRAENGFDHSFAADFVVRAYPGLGLAPRVRDRVQRTLALLGATAALLLLLAVANLTNLALAHRAARSGHAAIHVALGAGRGRLARRALLEHLWLGVAGAFVGFGVATAIPWLFRNASLSSLGAPLVGVEPDARVLAFTCALAVVAGLAPGLVPAIVGGRVAPGAVLNGVRHGRRATPRAHGALVVVQVALSTVLLCGAGLLARTVLELRATDLGFEPESTLRFSIDPRIQGRDDHEVGELAGSLAALLRAQPGVLSAGFVAPAPVTGSYLTVALYRSDGSREDDRVLGGQFQVTPGFMEAFGVRWLAGRSLEASDALGATSATEVPVVVTRAFARAAFPEVPPEAVLGRTLLRSYGTSAPVRIVGVIADLRLVSLSEESPPMVFYPWTDGYGAELTGWVRTSGSARPVRSRLASALRTAEPTLPAYDVRTGWEQVHQLIQEERVVARLALLLAGVGLLLSGVGLQGVLGYAVTQRRREIAVRTALGASRADAAGRVVRRALALTSAGLVLGAVTSVPAGALLAARLHGVAPLDAATYGVGMGVLLVTALVGSWAPARRSVRMAPREVLSAD